MDDNYILSCLRFVCLRLKLILLLDDKILRYSFEPMISRIDPSNNITVERKINIRYYPALKFEKENGNVFYSNLTFSW